MSKDNNDWALVSEYQDYKKAMGGKGRRLSSLKRDENSHQKSILYFLIWILALIAVGLIIFLVKGSWVIPFLQ